MYIILFTIKLCVYERHREFRICIHTLKFTKKYTLFKELSYSEINFLKLIDNQRFGYEFVVII